MSTLVLKNLLFDLEAKVDKNVQKSILKKLAIHDSVGEVKLYDMIMNNDDPSSYKAYHYALSILSAKGLVEIVLDEHEMMNVIRLSKVRH